MKEFLRILRYGKPYLLPLLFGFVLILILAQSGLFMPLAQRFVIDDILFHAKEPLSSVNVAFSSILDTQMIPDQLRVDLEANGVSISQKATVKIEEAGRKWQIHDPDLQRKYTISQQVFRLKLGLQGELGSAARVSDSLRKAFSDKGIQLSQTAKVSVEEAGNRWRVTDQQRTHRIEREGSHLTVYEGTLKLYQDGIMLSILGMTRTYTGAGWLVVVLIAIVVFHVITGLLSFVRTYVMTWASQRILFDMRNQAFSHLQTLSMRFYDVQGTGQILSRVTSDVGSLSALITSTSIQILSDAMMFLTMLVIMLNWHWKLTLVSLVMLPLVAGNYHYFIARMRPLWRNLHNKWADISTGLYEAVAGAKVVKAFNREHHQEMRVFHSMRQTLEWDLKLAKHSTVMGNLAGFFQSTGTALVLCYGGYLVLQDVFTIGTMVAFYQFLGRLYGPMMNLINVNATIQQAMISAERVFGLLDSQPTVEETPDAINLPEIQGDVKFEDVSFAYEPENPVLHHITFEAKPDMLVALVGPSGCGKSTIANLIARFYDPTEGRITIDGHDLRKVTLKSLRSQMGIVLQDNYLFQGPVKENIRFGKLKASDEEVVQAALAANAHQFIVEQLPEGYETEVGERGMRLSGGQKQRISIARTILRNPRILVLDEATSALDSESESLIQEALERLMKGKTTFVIAHRLSTVMKADMIVVLKEGRIFEMGSHEQLLEANGMYAEMFRKQFRIKQNQSEDAWLKS